MNIEVRKIRGREELEAVYRLTHDAYVAQGYCKPQPDGMLKHYERYDNLEETDIFVAVEDDEIVGTVSLTRNNMTGFPYDLDFPEEVQRFRHSSIVMGRYLGACWRIATHHECRNSMKVVLVLMKQIMETCAEYGVNETIHVFNPKHVNFYSKLLGFSVVAENHVDCVDAPGVLMYSDGRSLAIKWLDICEKRKMLKTVTIRDFWWPTAKTTPRTWWEIIYQDVPAILGCLIGYPMLWSYLLYERCFPV